MSGANPLLLQYVNTYIEKLEAKQQKQLSLIADLTATVTGYVEVLIPCGIVMKLRPKGGIYRQKKFSVSILIITKSKHLLTIPEEQQAVLKLNDREAYAIIKHYKPKIAKVRR